MKFDNMHVMSRPEKKNKTKKGYERLLARKRWEDQQLTDVVHKQCGKLLASLLNDALCCNAFSSSPVTNFSLKILSAVKFP